MSLTTSHAPLHCYMMTWSFVVSTEPRETISFTDITGSIDRMPEILNWRYVSGCLFIVTYVSVVQISLQIHGALPKLRFILAPINGPSCAGFADRETWDFINSPRPATA
jgi:hypothetical protein